MNLLKWVGGKAWLAETIAAGMPVFRDYYEPFAGGAALFFHLAHKYRSRIAHAGEIRPRFVISDSNKALIDTYSAVRDRPEIVAYHLENHHLAHKKRPKTHYKSVRDKWNSLKRINPATDGYRDLYQRAAAFLYLNRTCFNGLWRVNKSGEFNVPMGRYKNPSIYDFQRLIRASELLQMATIQNRSAFYHPEAARGDFVYFDPPYDPSSDTSSFTSYHPDKFDESDQRLLGRLFTEIARAGVHVAASNSNTKLIREIYKDFRIKKVHRKGSINSDPEKRGDVAELLITSY